MTRFALVSYLINDNEFIRNNNIYKKLIFLEMIPINGTVDRAWSEFERYSTNEYIRQLLDIQAASYASRTSADIA